MRPFLTVILVSSLLLPAVVRGHGDGPVAVAAGMEFDAGTVKQGATVRHRFIIKNKGTGELQILSVRPG